MSSRKNRSPEEQALRAKIRELLQESNISNIYDQRTLEQAVPHNHIYSAFAECRQADIKRFLPAADTIILFLEINIPDLFIVCNNLPRGNHHVRGMLFHGGDQMLVHDRIRIIIAVDKRRIFTLGSFDP